MTHPGSSKEVSGEVARTRSSGTRGILWKKPASHIGLLYRHMMIMLMKTVLYGWHCKNHGMSVDGEGWRPFVVTFQSWRPVSSSKLLLMTCSLDDILKVAGSRWMQAAQDHSSRGEFVGRTEFLKPLLLLLILKSVKNGIFTMIYESFCFLVFQTLKAC